MSKNAQRLSPVISTFGPGAMVDLPTRSVVVGGLDLWEMKGDSFSTIPEPRLTNTIPPKADKGPRYLPRQCGSIAERESEPAAARRPSQIILSFDHSLSRSSKHHARSIMFNC
jgi:hypothetical protein